MSDPIHRPAHYTGDIECIDAMVAAFGIDAVKMYARIAAFKYQWRAGKKDALPQELGKAIWYLRFANGDDPRAGNPHKSAGIAKTVDADMAAYEQRLEGYRAQHGVKG